MENQLEIISTGLNLFKEMFGYKSVLFTITTILIMDY